MNATSALDTLRQRRPEWTPWLAVVGEIDEQIDDPAWDATVPARPGGSHALEPLLTRASISLPVDLLHRSLSRVMERAAASGDAAMATLARLVDHDADTPALFAASICHEDAAVQETAARHEVDVDALRAVVTLVPLPFLQACRRHWAAQVVEHWTAPYCPICASWPAFVEVRGIERARYARCGRCGAEWYARLLQCPYCDNSDHEQLLTLVSQGSASANAVEACTTCRGYVKTVTRLQGCAPRDAYLEDLASVDLDIAALEAGYTRPPGGGYRLALAVTAQGARLRKFAWWT